MKLEGDSLSSPSKQIFQSWMPQLELLHSSYLRHHIRWCNQFVKVHKPSFYLFDQVISTNYISSSSSSFIYLLACKDNKQLIMHNGNNYLNYLCASNFMIYKKKRVCDTKECERQVSVIQQGHAPWPANNIAPKPCIFPSNFLWRHHEITQMDWNFLLAGSQRQLVLFNKLMWSNSLVLNINNSMQK